MTSFTSLQKSQPAESDDYGIRVVTRAYVRKSLSISRYYLYLMQLEKTFTPSIYIRPWTVWPAKEAKALIRAHKEKQTKGQLKQLARQLMEERKDELKHLISKKRIGQR